MSNPLDNINQTHGASEDDVLELMHTAMHAYRSLQNHLLRDISHGITQMDSRVLRYFERHPGATLSDLAHYSGRDKAQLTRLIRGLRDQALLQSEVDESDRRSTRISLTAAGKAVQRSLQQQARQMSAKAVEGMSAAQQQQLRELLRRVNRNLEIP
ncbi:MarR family winged helix-turn-helix transcriptional regulator [Noviherbaspirillum sedimenti]|nr:MarR family transcriptional regulator [Noviherbaspirillum sedimenti]